MTCRAVAEMLDEGQSTLHYNLLSQDIKKFSSYSAAASGLTEQRAIEAEQNSYLLGPDADDETNPCFLFLVFNKKQEVLSHV